jgi:serine phosphatase RsbU (regulator of sigma subunit)
MNRLVYFTIFFSFFFFTSHFVFAQEEFTIKGQTIDENGKPIGNVKVMIDKEIVTSTGTGIFQIHLSKGITPTKIIASKVGLTLKDWKYDEQGKKMTIILQSRNNILRGEVRNKSNAEVGGVYVTIQGINDNKPAKTNFDGKFTIILPNDYKANESTPFFIDGLPVESKEVSFKDENHYVTLRKPKAIKEKQTEEATTEQEEETNDHTIVKMKEKNTTNNKKVPAEFNYREEFEKLNKDLDNQRRMITESNEKVREDLSRITDKVKESGASVNRANIRDQMSSLELQLAVNNKAYTESQQKTNEVIEKLKMELMEKDSLNSLTQGKLEVVTAEKAQAEERFNRNILIASALIVFLLILAVIFYFVGKRIQKQSKQISIQAQELTHAYQEIKNTNKTLESQKMVLEDQKSVLEKQKVIIEKKNSNITASINYAQRIQHAMLPRQQDIQNLLPNLFLFFKPREIVSGDFYWIAEHEDNYGAKKIIIAAIDCTGHGVPGAFMSMVGDGLLNQIVKLQQISSPELILKELDKGIRDTLNQEETENKDGMDIAICVIDKYNKILEFAGAKNPLVYIQNGELKEIPGDKMHIGGQMRKGEDKLKHKHFTKHTIDTSPPTTFYIFTDGYEDQFGGEENKKFSKRQLHRVLFEHHKEPLYEQKWRLEKSINDWSGHHAQIDDILVIGFQV